MSEILQVLAKYKTENYIAFAIPFFFLFIFIEIFVAHRRKLSTYRLNDSINDLTLGIYQQLISISYRLFTLFVYIVLYENFHLFSTPLDSVFAWIISFFAIDFCYYWFHRTSHQVSIVWGSHEPHHSSEEYNLTVALRQGAFQGIFSAFFYFPLALLGVHPVIFLLCNQFNTLYQFWIHTRLIKKLPRFIEAVWNTPSHHRVHHGRNPKYIDKNHAGTFIIWDKLFGTFQVEEEEPVYGTVKPLASWNPFWANVQYWLHLWGMSKKTRGIKNKVLVWLKPPGWKPADLGENSPVPEVDVSSYRKYDPPVSFHLGVYTLVNFVFALLVSVNVIFMEAKALSLSGASLIFVVLISLFSLGWLMEGRKFSAEFDSSRVAISSLVLIIWGLANGEVMTFSFPALVIGAALLIWFELWVKQSLPLFDPAGLSLSKKRRYSFLPFRRYS